MIKHLDLFSGIGGFSYALDQVCDDVEHIFCDNNKFCQQVIKKNWPNSKIYDDIRSITAETADIVTGGFPCQPFSQAGKRKGTDDNRYLWPEMLRVIQLSKPQWIIAENVRGLLTIESGLVFEQVCLDLERAGYKVQPFIIPAVSVNAPHRRDRVWFVAHNVSTGWSRRKGSNKINRCDRGKEIYQDRTGTYWQENWHEIATELCGMDDGLPAELDGFKLSKAGHRNERLKALGNSIVPQVAIEIFKSIL